MVSNLAGVLTRRRRTARAGRVEGDGSTPTSSAGRKAPGSVSWPSMRAADYESRDGKPRYRASQSCLASRGIELPRGDLSSQPDAYTVDGLGHRQDENRACGWSANWASEPYEGSVKLTSHAAHGGGSPASGRRVPSERLVREVPHRRPSSRTCSRGHNPTEC